MARLWVHECFRVFSDRLIDNDDRETFITLLSDKLGTKILSSNFGIQTLTENDDHYEILLART